MLPITKSKETLPAFAWAGITKHPRLNRWFKQWNSIFSQVVRLEIESRVPNMVRFWGELSSSCADGYLLTVFSHVRERKSPAFPSSSYKDTNPFIEVPLS